MGTDEALESAERLIAADPYGDDGHYFAAIAYLRIDRLVEAERHAHQAIAAAPWEACNYSALASVLGSLPNRTAEARQAAHQVIELSPDSTSGYCDAGQVEWMARQWSDAEGYFLRALSIDPTDRDVQRQLKATRIFMDMFAGKSDAEIVDVDSHLRDLSALDLSTGLERRLSDESAGERSPSLGGWWLVVIYFASAFVCFGIGHLLGVKDGTGGSVAVGYGGGLVLTTAFVLTFVGYHKHWRNHQRDREISIDCAG
jgi:tetratricopeptide (TPR) repeat protein